MISRVRQAPTKSQMNGYTSAQVYQGIEHVEVTQREVFTQNVYIAIYTWYIPSTYPSFCTSRTRSCPLRRSTSLSSLRLGRRAEPLSFGHRQAANARLRRCWRPNDHSHVLISCQQRHPAVYQPGAKNTRIESVYRWNEVVI